jgi:hypothetical protein
LYGEQSDARRAFPAGFTYYLVAGQAVGGCPTNQHPSQAAGTDCPSTVARGAREVLRLRSDGGSGRESGQVAAQAGHLNAVPIRDFERGNCNVGLEGYRAWCTGRLGYDEEDLAASKPEALYGSEVLQKSSVSSSLATVASVRAHPRRRRATINPFNGRAFIGRKVE